MIGPPGCTGRDLQTLRHRRFALDPATLVFKERIDGGLDGYVWKVYFGDAGPFALKVFWDAAPPEFYHYYAPQQECHNAAVLQKMAAAVASGPVLIYNAPETKEDALSNFYPYSDESRLAQKSVENLETMDGTRLISSILRMVQCHGWLRLSGSVFPTLPLSLRPPSMKVGKIQRSMSSRKEYIALVYELVEDGENLPAAVEEVADFLWCAGFSHTLSPAARNWKIGVLVIWEISSTLAVFGGSNRSTE
ncbi:hypothetical protein QBC33DRAFT_548270 [Phialemonium atrogriseum]|uniref:Uncharacterized protein n=1 Tax=Phialemonium atrogriseum TaxID=1093897 RepID=A0AAJ0FD23_9PEZI|nr:uncharacterized protein QBC33DRAFT_548270 [Phialemonium atrogriseum]KAK1764171.1 hypothetical protein QBC33DRAFT_548270 [Phialemonium atrogriseum]